MAIYFTSDSHYGHAKILEYCNRPFSSIEEMNDEMVKRWNSRVRDGDTVYHLGDFSMGRKENTQIRRQLAGRVILVKGNHDRSTEHMLASGFEEVHKRLMIEVDGKKIYLAHIPVHLPDVTSTRDNHRNYPPELTQAPLDSYDYFLCGHIHNAWKRQGNTINVGVDVSNFYPLTFAELLERDE
jgi:calcineurin-like phosphoesterase family protein